MISVRRHYYGHENSPVDATTNTINFRSRRLRTSGDVSATVVDTYSTGTTTVGNADIPEATIAMITDDKDEFEMQDFSERSGF